MKHLDRSLWARLNALLVPVALALFLISCQAAMPSSGLTVAVQKIVSGRDIEVAGIPAQPELTERVRLEGIDVPDVDQQPWGAIAKAQLETRLHNQTVLLETDAEPRDATGRRLAYLWQGKVLVNEALVAEGYALVAPHPPNSKYDQRLVHAQERARVLGLGLWNPEQPLRVSPAEFRRQKG